MKWSLWTCTGAADCPGRPGVIYCSWNPVFWPVLISSVPMLLSAIVHNSMDYCSNHSVLCGGGLLRRGKGCWVTYVPVIGFCGWEDCKGTRGLWPLRFPPGLHDGVWASPGANHTDRFWAAPLSAVWKSALLPRQQREKLFKRNILSFSLIHCSWRFGTLLLNCSCYGYQHLYQQPFQRLWSYTLHIQSQPPRPPIPPPPFRGFCFIAASTISGLRMCSAQLAVQEQSTRNILLKSLFVLQNITLCTFLTCDLPVKISTIENTGLVPLVCIWSCLGHELLVSSPLWSVSHLLYPVVTL